MFESRLFFVDKLIDMGSKKSCCVILTEKVVMGHNFQSSLKGNRQF
jgi:UDP-N-acetylglucosamine 1-carboxyvinyltransferase